MTFDPERARKKDEVWLRVAMAIAELGTCPRRKVGCVILDNYGRVISTGYNGVPSGDDHCIDKGCGGESCAPGHGLGKCRAVHAEQNALLFMGFNPLAHTMYSTDSPCMDQCIKLVASTNIKRIVFAREYPQPDAKDFWLARIGTSWVHIPMGL